MAATRVRWGLTVALAGILLSQTALGDTSIVSDPRSARLSIEGPVSVFGTAPVPLEDLPLGEYALEAHGLGLPRAKGRLLRDDHGLVARSWSGPSALLYPPGFVHIERGEGRGWIFLLAGVGSGTMAVVKQGSVKNAEDDLQRAQTLYDLAIAGGNISEARLNLIAAEAKKNDAEEVRSLWTGYFAVVWLGSAVEAWLLTPGPTLHTNDQGQFVVGVPRAKGWRAGLRSALVPGAGQRYMGRDARSNFFASAFALTGAGAIFAHDAFLDARRDQVAAQRRFNQAESEEEARRLAQELEDAADKTDDRNILRYAFMGLTGGVYLWNIVDAVALGHSTKTSSFGWSVVPNLEGFTAELSWSMP